MKGVPLHYLAACPQCGTVYVTDDASASQRAHHCHGKQAVSPNKLPVQPGTQPGPTDGSTS